MTAARYRRTYVDPHLSGSSYYRDSRFAPDLTPGQAAACAWQLRLMQWAYQLEECEPP